MSDWSWKRIMSPMGGPSEAALARDVSGKVVLVTGASHGIGRATARKLARAGAKVLLLARSAAELDALAGEIVAAGGWARAYPCDLCDADATAAVAARMLADVGAIDVVVSNAGKSIKRSLALSYARHHDFQRTMGVNYLGPVRLLLAVLPSMRARRAGHVVNVSTVGVRIPPGPGWGAYQGSKSAFDVWLRSVAPEVRGDGVTISTVYMSLVHTRMSAPTAGFRDLPGLSPDEAADLVCRAIVERPRAIAPWWVVPAEAIAVLVRPIELALASALFREGDGRALRRASEALLPALALRALHRAGVIAPVLRTPRAIAALGSGVSPATACAVAAACAPDACALIDERGSVTYRELDARAGAIAGALRARHPGGLPRVAVMCRNHRGFVEATLAAARLGADTIFFGTELAGPQLQDALAQHRIDVAIVDREFDPALDAAGFAGLRVIAWEDGEAGPPRATLDALVLERASPPAPPRRPGKIVILTSGTTGTPKGAPRVPSARAIVGPLTTILERIGLRAGAPILIAPPLFHGHGLVYLGLALVLRAPMILRRKFEPEAALAAIAEHRVETLLAVPVMLRRLLAVPEAARARHDTTSLRAVVSGGAPLDGHLATAFLDAFGDVLYNLYGSTEVGFAAMADPRDLRAAPGTVGRPPRGTTLRLVHGTGEGPSSGPGRIFAGSALAFGGYSAGGHKEIRDGLLCTGDVGHFDADGRLFVDGREDDMIVSGGENVFPEEVERALAQHASVAEVAVRGVPDEEFGARLRAYVVLREGAAKPSHDALRAHVRGHVERYKVPREFVFVSALPRTATGKVVRARLDAGPLRTT